MTNYKTILIAVDLIKEAEQVLTKAKHFADSATNIHLLHVCQDPRNMYGNYLAGLTTLTETYPQLKDEIKTQTLVELEKLMTHCELNNAERKVDFGHAGDVIIKHAEILQADLIIIGSHGRHGIRLLLGSTANTILHHANCDVLAVRIR